MNTIKAILDKSDYEIYDDFINFRIDNYWLDEKLDELYPNNMYKGTIPTLLHAMEVPEERDTVWARILPKVGKTVVCPILMCPDDCDFSCTLIVAEIENHDTKISWKRLGIDKTTEYFSAEKIGTTVDWFENSPALCFSREEYMVMLEVFKSQFAMDKKRWEERNRKFREET